MRECLKGRFLKEVFRDRLYGLTAREPRSDDVGADNP